MLIKIPTLYRASQSSTSSFSLRLLSEASDPETNGEETEDIKVSLRNKDIRISKFIKELIYEEGMTPIFILQEVQNKVFIHMGDDDKFDSDKTHYLFMPKFRLAKEFFTN